MKLAVIGIASAVRASTTTGRSACGPESKIETVPHSEAIARQKAAKTSADRA
jgi:hypothetical protein